MTVKVKTFFDINNFVKNVVIITKKLGLFLAYFVIFFGYFWAILATKI